MNPKIYVIRYNSNNTVNIHVNMYELCRETLSYLYVKEYGAIVRLCKDETKWFTSLEDTKEGVKKIIDERIKDLKAEVAILESLHSVGIIEIQAESYNGKIIVDDI